MSEFLIFLVGIIAIILALILASQSIPRSVRGGQTTPPQGTTPPQATPLGEKTGTSLLTMFQDFYRQEIAAEEDVHRTLPFFATALGLIVTALSYMGSQFPDWEKILKTCAADQKTFDRHVIICAWPADVACIFLFISAFLAVGVLVFLALSTKRRGYERVGPEDAHLNRARALHNYYVGRELVEVDVAVMNDLREQLLQDFATALPYNRNLTLQRYRLRARAVACLLWSLFTALVATIIMLLTSKSGFFG